MASRTSKPWWQRRCATCGATLCPAGYCDACVERRHENRRLRQCGAGFRREPVAPGEYEGGPRE